MGAPVDSIPYATGVLTLILPSLRRRKVELQLATLTYGNNSVPQSHLKQRSFWVIFSVEEAIAEPVKKPASTNRWSKQTRVNVGLARRVMEEARVMRSPTLKIRTLR